MSGLAVGLKKGFIVTKRQQTTTSPSRRKGKLGTRTKLIRSVIREVTGFAPYEKRCIELIKSNAHKRSFKFAKRRLGSHSRAKRKQQELLDIIAKSRK